MSARPSQRLTRSAPWALRFASLPIPLVALAAVLRHLGLIELSPFFVTLALAWALAGAALVLSALAFRSIWVNGDAGLRDALIAVFIALVVLALPAAIVFDMFRLPRLADVSTDGIDPPLFTVAPETVTMRPLPGAATKMAQGAAYPDIVPRHYPLSPERVFQSVAAIVAQKGWRVTDSRAPDTDNEVGWIEAEASTLVFVLPVDIVIRVIGDEDGTLIDMRSASRIGAHDLGDNAARIRDFFASLDAALQGVTDDDMAGDDTDSDTPAPSDLPPLPVPAPVNGR
jgi:uncharacterized protein (DUF1499 family)